MPQSTVAAYARDALVPVSAEAESGGGAADEGEAEPAKEGGLEAGELFTKELALQVRPIETVEGPGT